MDYIKKVMTWWWVVVYQAIIEPPQLTLFNSVLDWVVAINTSRLQLLNDASLLCQAFSIIIVYLCTGLYRKVIRRWWCGGGGVVYLTDYRTTPVNIVQLCTGLGWTL